MKRKHKKLKIILIIVLIIYLLLIAYFIWINYIPKNYSKIYSEDLGDLIHNEYYIYDDYIVKIDNNMTISHFHHKTKTIYKYNTKIIIDENIINNNEQVNNKTKEINMELIQKSNFNGKTKIENYMDEKYINNLKSKKEFGLEFYSLMGIPIIFIPHIEL